MNLKQLDKKQFFKTMTEKMIDVTETVEALVDVWGYAEKLLPTNLLSEHDFKKRLVEAVYANSDNSHHHVLLFGSEKNIHIVIIIDVLKKCIDGHYILDINKEYRLNKKRLKPH